MNPLLPQDFERGYETALPLPAEWVPPTPWWMSPWLLGATGLLFLYLFTLIILSMRKEAFHHAKRPPPPRESAMKALLFLRKEHATLPISESVHRLSEILRMYLQHRLRIPARSLSTKEIRLLIEQTESAQAPLYASQSSTFIQSYHPVIYQMMQLLEKCDSYQFRLVSPLLTPHEMTSMMREAETLLKSDPASPSQPFDPTESYQVATFQTSRPASIMPLAPQLTVTEKLVPKLEASPTLQKDIS